MDILHLLPFPAPQLLKPLSDAPNAMGEVPHFRARAESSAGQGSLALQVQQHSSKGRILVASKDFPQGELLMSEKPLLQVASPAGNAGGAILELEGSWEAPSFRYPVVFYWAALLSLTSEESDLGCLVEDEQSLALQLHRPSTEVGEDVEAVLVAVGCHEGLAAKVEDLLQIWIFNSLRFWDCTDVIVFCLVRGWALNLCMSVIVPSL